jgi:hypothetical protein
MAGLLPDGDAPEQFDSRRPIFGIPISAIFIVGDHEENFPIAALGAGTR